MDVIKELGGITREELKLIYEKKARGLELTVEETFTLVAALNADYVADLQSGDIVQVYGYSCEMVVDEYCITEIDGVRYLPEDEPPNPVRCSVVIDGKRYSDSYPALQVELLRRPGVDMSILRPGNTNMRQLSLHLVSRRSKEVARGTDENLDLAIRNFIIGKSSGKFVDV